MTSTGDNDAPQPRRPQHQPTAVDIPRDYNAAHDLLARNAARSAKVAFVDASSGAQLTYGELTDQAHRFANALRAGGFAPETRVMLAMLDTLEWPVVFLGCILAGVVPIAANTLADDQGLRLHAARLARTGPVRVQAVAAVVRSRLIGNDRHPQDRGRGRGHGAQLGCSDDPLRRHDAACRGHLRRRCLLLAVFQRVDRHAQGHRAPAQPPDPDGRTVRARRAGHPGEGRRLFRRQAVLRLWPGQLR